MAQQYSGFSPLTAANMQMLETLLPPQQAAPQMPAIGSGVSASLAPSQKIGANYNPVQDASQTTPHDNGAWWFQDAFNNIMNQPITKGIINALATPAYMVGNAINSTAKDIQDGNPQNIPFDATIGAVGKGLSAGIGQNPNDAVMPSTGLESVGQMQDGKPISTDPASVASHTATNFMADMLLDPLSYVDGGPLIGAAKGAVQGAQDARRLNALAKAGSDTAATMGSSSIKDAIIQGAKDGWAGKKAGQVDAQSARDMNAAAKDQGANVGFTEDVPGLKFLPDSVTDGEAATTSAKDMADVGANEANARNMAASSVGTDNAANIFAPTDPENAAMMANLVQNAPERTAFSDTLGKNMSESDAAKIVQMAKDKGLDPTPGDLDNMVAKTEPLPESRTIEESVQTQRANPTDKPDLYAPSDVKTDLPPLVKASDYSHYSPADRFVSESEHWNGTEPKYSKLQAKNLNEYFGNPTQASKDINWPGVISDLKNTPVGRVLKNKENPAKTLSAKMLGDMIDADFAENPKKFTGQDFMKWLPDKFLAKHAQTVETELPTVEQAVKLGLDPEDFSQALADGGVDNLTKPTGNLNRILDQIGNGEVPPEQIERFHGFMRNFSENPEMSLEDAVEAAKDFVANNKDAVKAASDSLRSTADGGRLSFLKNAGESPAVGLNRIVDPGTAEAYRVPFTPEKTAQVLEASSNLADAAIKAGPNPEFVSDLADRAFQSTVKMQAGLKDPLTGGTTWTTNAAIHPFTYISKEVHQFLKDNKVFGRSYAHLKDSMVMRALGKVDAEMKKAGVFPYLTNVMPKDGAAIRASAYDILASLPEADRIHFLGWGKVEIPGHMFTTQIMDGAETLLRTVIDNGGELQRAKVLPEFLDNLKGKFSDKDIEREIALNLDSSVKDWNAKLASKALDEEKFLSKREAEYRKLYRTLENSLPEIAERVLQNNALHGSIMTRRIEQISEDTMNRLKESFSGGSVGDMVNSIAEASKPLKSEMEPEAAKLVNQVKQDDINTEFATPIEQMSADHSVKISDYFNKQDMAHRALANDAKKMRDKALRAKNPDEAAKYQKQADELSAKAKDYRKQSIAARKMEEAAQQEINKMNTELLERTRNPLTDPKNLDEALEGGEDSFFNVMREEHAAQVVRRRYAFQSNLNAKYGKNANWDQMTSGVHGLTATRAFFWQAMNDLNNTFGRDEIKLAFNALQNSEKVNTPAMESMNNILGTLFDDSSRNIFSRNGAARDHLNEILDAHKAPSEWRFESKDPQEMAQEWKSWTVDDPMRFMTLMDSVSNKAMQDIHLAATFSSAGEKTLSEAERKSGNWVKIDPKSLGNNRFAKLIDKSRYYPKQVALEIPEWNRRLLESRSFKGTFGQIMDEIVDPMVNALKMTNTVVKPGHHLMSLIGNILTNSLIPEVKVGLKEYRQGIQVMTSRRQLIDELSGAENFKRAATNATQGVHLRGADNGENSVRFTNITGKGPVHLRNEDIYSLAEAKGGLFPDSHGGNAEDWLTPDDTSVGKPGNNALVSKIGTVTQGANKGLQKLLNNRFIKMNKFTSQRENLTRLPLFIAAMKSKPFRNFDEAANYAMSVVKKAYPTSQDFSAAESKYIRRIFFYYTWQRGILPVIAEGAIAHPGWALAPAKFSYDLAEANGIHPDSLGDPFPANQMFPQYYKDLVLGPQWMDDNGHYWGFNPTSPVLDTLNSLGAGVSLGNLMMNPFDPKSGESKLGRTFLGMTNPFIKVPADLISGTNTGTGVPIKDQGEYLQDQVGPLRTISELTGKDLVSSTNGLLANRTGTDYKNGFATPQAWWDHVVPVAANYGTGLQIKDFNSASAQKSAQYDATHNNPNKPSNQRQAQTQAARGGLWFNSK